MEEVLSQVVLQFPLAGICLYALWVVYGDLKKEQGVSREERVKLMDTLLELTDCIKDLER